MKIDRELLELAAKAAGIKTLPPMNSSPILWDISDDENHRIWNPLADDGDALRLAIDTGVQFGLTLVDSRGYAEAGDIYLEFEWDMHRPSDRYEATRRAIVRAAAELATKEAK